MLSSGMQYCLAGGSHRARTSNCTCGGHMPRHLQSKRYTQTHNDDTSKWRGHTGTFYCYTTLKRSFRSQKPLDIGEILHRIGLEVVVLNLPGCVGIRHHVLGWPFELPRAWEVFEPPAYSGPFWPIYRLMWVRKMLQSQSDPEYRISSAR